MEAAGHAERAAQPAPPDATPFAPAPWRSFATLCGRELARVLKLWTQTIVAPVVAQLLFILVFGLALSGRIEAAAGVGYDVFIVPGLIAMAMAQAAYSNNSSSLFQARSDRYINDVLAAPMHPWQMHLGLASGGWFRALAIGGGLAALAIPITGAPVHEPLVLVAAIAILSAGFGALGIVVGTYAETFDRHAAVNNLAILPLAFVGGVFYSIEVLPSPWFEVSHVNPLFHLVNLFRYGFLGTGDAPILVSLIVTAAVAAALVGWAQWLFRTGRGLKP